MKKTILTISLIVFSFTTQAHVWDELAILARPNDKGTWDLEKYSFIQPSIYTNALFFDYNNDGHLDLLIMGQGGDWNIPSTNKFLLLYRNLGPGGDFRFEKVSDTGLRQACDEGFYNPISAGDWNHDGYTDIAMMSYDDGRRVEIYLNDHGSGRFTRLTADVEGTTNGSVMFADIDNDGWLDLEYSGYSESTPTALKMYRNNRDGSLTDISDPAVTGTFQGQSTLADLNGDGWLDIISCGSGDNHTYFSNIYLRTPADGGWHKYDETDSGIKRVSRATPLAADLNADGILDLVVNGEAPDGSGYRTRIYYGSGDGKYELDTSFPVVGINQDGGINMGDWNGDGQMDLIVGGYLGRNDGDMVRYSSPLRVYENRPTEAGIQPNSLPEPPAEVSATLVDDHIVITWKSGYDKETSQEALRYNLFMRNNTTGEIYTLIPADLDTGLLKVGNDLQTSLASDVKSYEISLLGSGDYTVGVQTLDQAFAGSRFSTYDLNGVISGMAEVASLPISINVGKGLLKVDGNSGITVSIYSAIGALVASGTLGSYTLEPGLYIVSTTDGDIVTSRKVIL